MSGPAARLLARTLRQTFLSLVPVRLYPGSVATGRMLSENLRARVALEKSEGAYVNGLVREILGGCQI